MQKFPAEAMLTYLGELITINPLEAYEFSNKEAFNEVTRFLEGDKADWNIKEVDPHHIYELFVLEEILNSRFDNLTNTGDEISVENHNEFYNRYWGSDFSRTFFDPNPNPFYSLAGWINYNYCKQYEMDYEVKAPISLHGVMYFIYNLVSASPTCDEPIHEHISDMLSSAGEDVAGEDVYENPWDWLTTGNGNDVMYELYKVLLNNGYILRDLLTTDKDTLAYDLGFIIVEDLTDTVLEQTETMLEPEEFLLTPAVMIRSWLEMINSNYVQGN